MAEKANGADSTNLDAPLSLEQYRKLFDTARQEMVEGRKVAELCREFYDLDQLTAAERSILAGRGQPAVVNPRIQRAIGGIMGVVEQSKTDPRALMRNPPDAQPNPQPGASRQPQGLGGSPPTSPMPQAAVPQAPQQPKLDAGDVATMTLRYICDTTHFKNTTKMDVLENGLVEGCGAAIIEVDEKKDVTATQIRWEEFFFDPKSRRHDFKDARYLGIAKWMYADDLSALYPEEKTTLESFQSDGGQGLGLDATWEDRPESRTPWVDSKLHRLMVVDMYHSSGGKWYRCVFYAGGILASMPSEYQDDFGRPCCPIEAWSAYINRKNERYGEVKGMLDLAREINMRRSKALHEINSRQIQQTDPNAPPVDTDLARKEAARPDGVLPSGYQIVPRQDNVANNLEMLAEAKSEMERMAPSPAILGRQSADASGRAQQIRQQAGLTELSRVLNRHGEWETRVYTQMWWRARQFWDAPKWIRVTNDTQAPQYVQVNEPTVDPMTGQQGFKNHIAKMDVDIVLDKVPDTATLEQEIFTELAQLAQVYGPQAVPFSVVLEMSSLPKKRELIQKLEDHQAAQAPQQQIQMQAMMAKMQAELAEIQSVVKRNNASADLAEAQTVDTAMKAHLEVNRAAQLPPGITIDNSGKPVSVIPPPPPGASGALGRKPNGPPP